MRSLIRSLPALAVLLAAAVPAEAQADPYRQVSSVIIAPDIQTNTASYYITTIDDDGMDEFWEVWTHMSDGWDTYTSLMINGEFRFEIKNSIGPFAIAVQSPDLETVVDEFTFQTDPVYQAFWLATEQERGFVQELMEEYSTSETMQGILPEIIWPEVGDDSGAGDDGDFAFHLGAPTSAAGPATTSAPQVSNRDKCIQDMKAAGDPKPKDCEGAWDSYACCCWEVLVDACTRLRYCNDLIWYEAAVCHAAAVVANGADTSACVLSLPFSAI